MYILFHIFHLLILETNVRDVAFKCSPDRSTLLLGDFDGNGTPDILCKTKGNLISIAYLAADISLSSTDSVRLDWCDNENDTIYKGI